MARSLTVVIPYYNGQRYIGRLLKSLPDGLEVILVDDCSDRPLQIENASHLNIRVLHSGEKGYFAGAVNAGLNACDNDVLVLNQDVWFSGYSWLQLLEEKRDNYAFIGERIQGEHPSFGKLGYIHGTFMFLRRDMIGQVGLLNEKDYPLWGGTAEYQWRVARNGFGVLPLESIPEFHHERKENERFGSGIRGLLTKESHLRHWLVRTPPLLSVIVPCYNYGRYLQDCINSLIGGKTSLGDMPGQTLQSFEVIIVNDASTDDSAQYIDAVVSEEKGIRAYHLTENVGTANALNYGIERAVGQYITFLSADDMREPDSLEKLVRACMENPHSFAYDDIWIFNGAERTRKWQMEEYDFDKLIHKNQVHAGIVYPRIAWSEVGGYPSIMSDGREDWAFNVALGIQGWCGVHVSGYGYLYRREGQNRTETNTSPLHRQRFTQKMHKLFPAIYQGSRPVACCGKGRPKKSVKRTSAKTLSTASGEMLMATSTTDMVKMEYTGNQTDSIWDGSVTRTRYRFGRDQRIKWVDRRDVDGFLKVRDRHNNSVFRTVENTTEMVGAARQPASSTKIEETKPASGPDTTQEVKETVVTTMETQEEPAEVEALDYPDPNEMYPADVKKLELTKEQWEAVYRAEMSKRNRKSITQFIEEKLANWQEE